MGYDIHIEKPEDRRHDNRGLADEVLRAFPEFREFPVDHVMVAREVASTVGLTEEEWLRDNLGIELDADTADSWTQMTFWETTICITVPNFPCNGVSEATDRLWRYIEFFVKRGFCVLHPESGERLSPAQTRDAIVRGYEARQETVRTVAQLSGGHAVGDAQVPS
jgi:hypothetical protein